MHIITWVALLFICLYIRIAFGIVWYLIYFWSAKWLRRAGCISQYTYLLYMQTLISFGLFGSIFPPRILIFWQNSQRQILKDFAVIAFSHLPSFDRANKPSNEKILNWSDSDQLHFHTCTPAINCARNHAVKKTKYYYVFTLALIWSCQ